MANTKISDLTAASSAAAADLIVLVQSSQSKKLTIANLFANIATPVVINEAGADQDTRIEGDTDQNLIFVDASTDRVGFGTGSPSEKVDVAGNIAISAGYPRFTQAAQALTGTGALANIDVTKFRTTIDTTSGTSSNTLPDGVDGQVKFILQSTHAGNHTMTVTNGWGMSSIVFTALGSSVLLYFTGGKWAVMGQRSLTIS